MNWLLNIIFHVPKLFAIHNEPQLEQIINEVTFPCILKPVYSSDFRKRIDHKLYKKAIRVEEPSELREKYLFYRPFGELMLQEIIPGDENLHLFGQNAF